MILILLFITSTFSIGIKVSLPFGIKEPVNVLIQVLFITSLVTIEPAGFLSIISIKSFFISLCLIAYPSIPDVGNSGLL